MQTLMLSLSENDYIRILDSPVVPEKSLAQIDL